MAVVAVLVFKSAGTLNSNTFNALGSLATVSVADGAIFGVGATQTIGTLSEPTPVTYTASVSINGAYTLTVGNTSNNLSSTFSGVISGAGGLAKTNSGQKP